MKLFVGLGNPEKKYENTRHNLGASIINQFVRTHHDAFLQNKPKLSAQLYECKDRPLCLSTLFAIPTEYMNNSGISVKKIMDFYKIKPNNLYVIHDDLDIPIGEYKVQFDRGPAGHNGIKSIIDHLGTQSFHRIRVGIGKPQNNIPIEDYVLQKFSKEEQGTIDKIYNLQSTINDLIQGS